MSVALARFTVVLSQLFHQVSHAFIRLTKQKKQKVKYIICIQADYNNSVELLKLTCLNMNIGHNFRLQRLPGMMIYAEYRSSISNSDLVGAFHGFCVKLQVIIYARPKMSGCVYVVFLFEWTTTLAYLVLSSRSCAEWSV